MVTITARIQQDTLSEGYIALFNSNLFTNAVSNIMFRNDSFIKFASKDIVVIYLNTMIPKELPFYLYSMVYIVGLIFNLHFLTYLGVALFVTYFTFHNLVFHLFKLGLRKQGFKGKIEAV